MAPTAHMLKYIPPMAFPRSLPAVPFTGGAPPANQPQDSEAQDPDSHTNQILVPVILILGILAVFSLILGVYFSVNRKANCEASLPTPVLTHQQWIADRHLRQRSLLATSQSIEADHPCGSIDPCYKLNRQNEGYFGGIGESGYELQRHGDWTGSTLSEKKSVTPELARWNIKVPEDFSLK